MLIFKSNSYENRDVAIKYIQEQKKNKPDYTVIDIGGIANPWCKDLVDYYVDFNGKGNNIINGDIQSEEVWNKIRALNPDFCICTHTLEDIRDPGWVLSRISDTFKAGFISMPNKHQEMTRGIESILYPGWCHHRWIFSVRGDVLMAIAKFPVSSTFSVTPLNFFAWMTSQLSTFKLFNKVLRKLKIQPLTSSLSWLNKDLAKPNCELSLLFEGEIAFEYINNDYAGSSLTELVALFENEIGQGL